MTTTPNAIAATSVIQEIQAWSASRPDWQRDALRRIITQEDLSATDIGDLEFLCRQKHGATSPTSKPLKVVPLDVGTVTAAKGAAKSVNLVSIGKLERVNRLSPTQELRFGGAPGLTVIFGENGSGKSGYA